MVKGPSELHHVFTVSLNGVALDHEQVKGAMACVLDFVRHPLFTQGKFFAETGISMLNTAVIAADAVRNSSKFDPWGAIDVEAGPVIADLKSCREKIVTRRKAVKDTRERWFSADTVASSGVGETAPRTAVRIPDVVELGDVQYVAEHQKFGLPCCSRYASSLRKSKKRRAPVSPGVAKKNKFLMQVHLLAVLHYSLLFRKVLRSLGKAVVIAVKPHFSKGDTNNNLIVYLYEFLAISI